MIPILNLIVTGILEGAIYSIIAVGLSLILGVMRIASIAHGDLMVLGALLSFWMFTILGVGPFLSLIIVVPSMFIIGFLMQKFVIGPGIKQVENQTTASLVITYGIAFIISQCIFVFWTGDYRAIVVEYAITNINIGDLSINIGRLLALAFTIVLTALTYIILSKTTFGKAIRACTQDREAAMTLGVNFERLANMTYGFSASLAAVAGLLYIITHILNPGLGLAFLTKGFVALILGGMGSIIGPFIGGLIIGICESLGVYVLGGLWKDTIAYLVLLIILLIRPTGILGAEEV